MGEPTARGRTLPLREVAPATWDELSGFEENWNVQMVQEETREEPRPARSSEPRAQCGLCFGMRFATVDEQRSHFRGDWHVYNTRRRLRGEKPATEQEFEQMVEAEDVSSISGSESDDDVTAPPTDTFAKLDKRPSDAVPWRPGPRVEFRLGDGSGYLSVWRALVLDSHERKVTREDIVQLAEQAKSNQVLACVLMYGGGHFCGVIFDGQGKVLQKKSIHRYTTRRKQGGSQNSNDNAGRAKSAGATLRRHEQAVLRQEVKDTVTSWNEHLSRPGMRVFYRVPNQEKDVFFGPPESRLLDRKRTRKIPFTTRRATFEEVKRVYAELFSVRLTERSGTINLRSAEKSVQQAARTLASTASSAAPRKLVIQASPGVERIEEVFSCVCQGKRRIVPEMTDTEVNMMFLDSCKWKKGKRKVQGKGMTPLDVATLLGHAQLVHDLLERGADPITTKPYARAQDKETRNVFRRFWHANPDAHDYASGGIPSPLSPAMEERERKKLEERALRAEAAAAAAEAGRKAEAAQEQATAEEAAARRKAAKAVTPRERRAMAAEIRAGTRCAQCCVGLSGLVPFEKNELRYCSMDCVGAAASRGTGSG